MKQTLSGFSMPAPAATQPTGIGQIAEAGDDRDNSDAFQEFLKAQRDVPFCIARILAATVPDLCVLW
jgi:hypothetical protein